MKLNFFVLFFTLFLTTNLNAQTQAEMTNTAMNDFKKTDKVLNVVYNKLIKILSQEEKKLLIKAQKDWLKFRDSHCEFEIIEYQGGSIQSLIKYNCMEDLTKIRIEDLNSAIGKRDL